MRSLMMRPFKQLSLAYSSSSSLENKFAKPNSLTNLEMSAAASATPMKSLSVSNDGSLPIHVHSTLRDSHGQQALPYGLDWYLDAHSHITFVRADGNNWNTHDLTKREEEKETSTSELRTDICTGIIRAYNQWAFAKGLPYKSLASSQDEIESIELCIDDTDGSDTRNDESKHVRVHWKTKEERNQSEDWHSIPNPNIPKLLRRKLDFVLGTSSLSKSPLPSDHELSAVSPEQDEGVDPSSIKPGPEVWMNGSFVSYLNSEQDLENIVDYYAKVQDVQTRLLWKQSLDGKMICIDRYYRGMLRDKVVLWHHILDNLYALEDAQVLDESQSTLIGTAILPDWIMGGTLASRLWVRQHPDTGDLLFLRPLRNDDIETSCDRRFEIKNCEEHAWIVQKVANELNRLRYLASLQHPFVRENTREASDENDVEMA